MKMFATPLWAELAPFYVADEDQALVASGEDERPIATAGDPNDRAEEVDCSIADLIVGAPAYAMLVRIVAAGGMLERDREGEGHGILLSVPVAEDIGLDDTVQAFEEWPIELDEYGLPVIPGDQYRRLAALIGWPALPAPGGAG